LFDIKHILHYDPTVTYISTCISALGNIPALIHLLLHFVRHINQPKPIKHPVDVCHAPNITQRFRTVNYCSDLFYIAQRQQHRAPRQTFAVLSPVNPELFCVFATSAFSYFIREWQAGIGLKTHFLIDQSRLPQMLLCRRCSQLLYCPVSPLPLCPNTDLLFLCTRKVHAFLIW